MTDVDEFMAWNENLRELHGKLFNKSKNFIVHGCIHYIGDLHEFMGEGLAYIVLPLNKSEDHVYRGVSFKKKPFSSDMTKRSQVITVTYKHSLKKNFLRCSCQGWNDKEKKEKGELTGVQCSHTLALKLYWKRKAFEKNMEDV